jgi:hypothetical protein
MLQLLYPGGNSSWYLLDKKLGVPELVWICCQNLHPGPGHGYNQLLHQECADTQSLSSGFDSSYCIIDFQLLADSQLIDFHIAFKEREYFIQLITDQL